MSESAKQTKGDSSTVIRAELRFIGNWRLRVVMLSQEELIQSCLTTQFVDLNATHATSDRTEGTTFSLPSSSRKTGSTGLKQSSLVLVKS